MLLKCIPFQTLIINEYDHLLTSSFIFLTTFESLQHVCILLSDNVKQKGTNFYEKSSIYFLIYLRVVNPLVYVTHKLNNKHCI